MVAHVDHLLAFGLRTPVLEGGCERRPGLVDGVDEAIAHIEENGSHHSDAIITADKVAADKFLAEVDSAIVLHNASTQFADGGEFGLGAEIGISTTRLHAYGPMGAEELTTTKFVVIGEGQTRT